MTANQVALWYLVASICFILALKGLSHPSTARRGNILGIVGMAIAVVVTLALVYSHTRNVGDDPRRHRRRWHRRRDHRAPRADDADARARRGVPLAGRAGRGADRDLGDPRSRGLRPPCSDPVGQPARALHRHVHRRDHVLRIGDRVRQAVGQDPQRARRVRRSAHAEPRAGGRDDRLRHLVLHVARRVEVAAVHRDDRDRVRCWAC